MTQIDTPMRSSRVAVAGIGGFASSHHAALRELEKEAAVRVVATCDPRHEELTEGKDHLDFQGREVAVFSDFGEMLKRGGMDWVSVATPIGFHAPMHAACVERGLPCYLEKPPTLDPRELEQMIAIDAGNTPPTLVGFNYIYEPARLRIKERLLAGEFGPLRRVAIRAEARRPLSYFQRNNWAGRMQVGKTLILDSCMGNAMAHHLHNILFFAGTDRMHAWAGCEEVCAQLYRANPIDGPDTVFLKARLDAKIELRLAMTHACDNAWAIEETLVCEGATIRIRPNQHIKIESKEGSLETIPLAHQNLLKVNLRIYHEMVRGVPHPVLSTLADCRAFVLINALAYLSSQSIQTVTPPASEFVPGENYWRIPGIERTLQQFVESADFSLLAGLGENSSRVIPAREADWNDLPKRIASLRFAGAPA